MAAPVELEGDGPWILLPLALSRPNEALKRARDDTCERSRPHRRLGRAAGHRHRAPGVRGHRRRGR